MSQVPPSIEYASADRDAREARQALWRQRIWTGFFVVLLLIGVGFCLMPAHGRARAGAKVIHCASQLRQIGQALAHYAKDNGGRFPNRMEELVLTELTPAMFICPNSDTEAPAATGPTPQQTLANMYAKPGHCSYTYIGAGLMSDVPDETVIAYEPLGHHPPADSHRIDGANVLFADGHVMFLNASEMKQLLAELAAGTNPPPVTKAIRGKP